MHRDLEEVRRDAERIRRDYPRDVAEIAQRRWVRVMCDYSADGVWAPGSISPEWLPISPELMLRIHEWQMWYERLPHEGFALVSCDEAMRFAETGLAIAIQVKRELPDWTVVYSDEGIWLDERKPPPKGAIPIHDRPEYEYEIGQDMVADL